MYIALWIAILIICILISFFLSSTHLFVLASVIYALYYFASWSYKEGSRRWSWLRSLYVWNLLRQRYFHHQVNEGSGWKNFERAGDTFLFIVHPPGYGLSTLLTFGLHGKTFGAIRALQPLIAMPRVFFAIPGLTDIVQWCGGIVHSRETVEAALTNHRSVVWSPTGPMDHSSYFSGGGGDNSLRHLEENALDQDDMFTWIAQNGKKCNLHIVPVVHVGENAAYSNWTGQMGARWWLLGSLQQWMWQRFQYEFPLVLGGLFGTIIPRPCPLTTIVGTPISSTAMSAQLPGKKIQKTPAILKMEFLAKYAELRQIVENIQASCSSPTLSSTAE